MISIHLVVAVEVVLADSVAEFYKRGAFFGRIHSEPPARRQEERGSTGVQLNTRPAATN